jgi:hypothetical protein
MTCRVAARFVAAPEWNPAIGCENSAVARYVRLLHGELQRERMAYAACQRALNNKTSGSMWRLCVIPHDNGWVIEARQLLLHAPKTKLPCVRVRGSRVTYMKSIKVAECYAATETDLFHILGEFNRYPQEWLTGYDELVAVYLRAVYDMRLVSGTGLFKRSGRSLVKYHQRKDRNAKAKKDRAKRLSGEEVREAPT